MPRNNSSNAQVPNIRVAVLGDRDVGKSALVVRFLTKRFIGEYVSEQEMTYQHDVTINGNKAVAEICDSLVQKDQQSHLKRLTATTDAYLLVYSVCNHDSFDYACRLAQKVKAAHFNLPSNDDVPILLVGNKCDLDHFREVKRSEGESFSQTLPACQFIETSAAESYSDVERAFRIAFKLAKGHARSSPTPNGRSGRKSSITQMAQMIRHHYKRGHLSTNSRSNSLERGLTMMKGNSSHGSVSPLSPDLSLKRKIKKHLTHGYANEHQNAIGIAKSQLSPKCKSLLTLTESPGVERKSTRDVADVRKNFQKPLKLNRNGRSRDLFNSAHSDVSSPSSLGKISLSSDDAFEISDLSANEEDTFSSGASSSTVSPLDTPTKERKYDDSRTKNKEVEAGKRAVMNKKNLHLALHSEGEFDDFGGCGSNPPKSAPLVQSTSNQKFRYFPNGAHENQELLKSSKIVMSPLLSHRSQAKVKSPKEEKKSPSQNFLKQFFKNSFHMSSSHRNFGSDQNFDRPISPSSSVASLCSFDNESTETLNESDFHRSGSIFFHASSSSLSSVIGNDPIGFEPIPVTYSAPTTPQMRKSGLRNSRRPSIREAVGVLMRKKKQSISIDYLKHIETKERIL